MSRLPPHTCDACGEACHGPMHGTTWRTWLVALVRDLWRWDPDEVEAILEAAMQELARRRP
jgi:hypothetical protein